MYQKQHVDIFLKIYSNPIWRFQDGGRKFEHITKSSLSNTQNPFSPKSIRQKLWREEIRGGGLETLCYSLYRCR